MLTSRRLIIVLGAVLLLAEGRLSYAQPLLREGEPEAEADQESEADPEVVRRRARARQKAELEEERQLKLQQELMQLRGEQMLAEQEEIKRRDRTMRYALLIAVVVIATTLAVAYVRSQGAENKHGPRPDGSL